ncbi:hypothetical protein ACLJYM_14625 [Rhizobium giardinii]|uniref:hypothetical protein n=1 Tax=Rhizobium giardinii TaxID=56731 RepID=UPI0039DFE6B0
MALDLYGVRLALAGLVNDHGCDQFAEGADDFGVGIAVLHGDDLRQAFDVFPKPGDGAGVKLDDVRRLVLRFQFPLEAVALDAKRCQKEGGFVVLDQAL